MFRTSDGIILSQRSALAVARDYRRRYGLRLRWAGADGRTLLRPGRGDAFRLGVVQGAVRDALREAVRWGEAYTFFLSPGVVSWVAPLVEGEELLGGALGGEVIVAESDREEAARQLRASGFSGPAAARFVRGLPVWPQERAREAAQYLYDTFYQIAGWKPVLLVRNRENAIQQRQIAEEIHQRKRAPSSVYPYDEERMLLSLIRVGDRKGARRVLNQLLAAMFLHSPNTAVLRARAIELMGYLVRAAVEDNPLLEPMIERNQRWLERLVAAPDFDAICEALRDALDDFIESVAVQGFNRSNPAVRRALDHIAANFQDTVTLAGVGRAAGLSAYRVAHLVKDYTGRSVMQHVQRLRLHRAQQLLEEGRLSGAAIAAAVGFHDQSHLIRQFRALTGTTPGRYRRGPVEHGRKS